MQGVGMSHLDDQREFHEAVGHPVSHVPYLPLPGVGSSGWLELDEAIGALEALAHKAHEKGGYRWLRIGLMAEEVAEYLDAELDDDLVGVADALGDIGVIADGTALAYGIPLDEVRKEIHRANMSKLGEDGKPILREDGKVLKGPNYSPPDIAAILEAKA
jgi:predicted HAD superfamily Cof-like phosphohydrolase